MVDFFIGIGGFFVYLWSFLSSLLPIGFIRITVEPVVFECGNENYCILWETSTKGSGYVKYTYNGEEKIIWDETSGIIRTDDFVHRVVVPKKELQGNTYKVGSQYVGFKFGYSAAKGRTVESKEYNFRGVEKEDDINVLCISDIHYMEKQMYQSLEYFKETTPDVIFYMGDITSDLISKEQFADYILKDAHDLSGGEIPIVYLRGNHETRGEFGAQLIEYFPTETGEFYYTFEFGPMSAVVLDYGEDKEDDHKEYSGLVNFAEYREKEFGWLCSLEKEEFADSTYKLALCHSPVLDDHFGKDWTQPLKDLEMDLIVGGHYHKCDFVDGELPIFFDGGKINSKDGCWAASMMTLKDGQIHMLTIDNSGNVLLDKTIDA
ncbi:MAG: metallophosphoesterase [Ruminococcaceae bacterium]|nr:metallophosphoesterase [Oscillospiraceae bacterium]